MEGANIKLAVVATDILSKSGCEMPDATVGGSADASALAELAKGRIQEKIPQLERALAGQFGPHQRFMVATQWKRPTLRDASGTPTWRPGTTGFQVTR